MNFHIFTIFYITAKKKYDTEYEPDTMSSFSRSIQRYSDDNNAKINILKDEQFKVSREVLKSKCWELRKQGKGGRPNAIEALPCGRSWVQTPAEPTLRVFKIIVEKCAAFVMTSANG